MVPKRYPRSTQGGKYFFEISVPAASLGVFEKATSPEHFLATMNTTCEKPYIYFSASVMEKILEGKHTLMIFVTILF